MPLYREQEKKKKEKDKGARTYPSDKPGIPWLTAGTRRRLRRAAVLDIWGSFGWDVCIRLDCEYALEYCYVMEWAGEMGIGNGSEGRNMVFVSLEWGSLKDLEKVRLYHRDRGENFLARGYKHHSISRSMARSKRWDDLLAWDGLAEVANWEIPLTA